MRDRIRDRRGRKNIREEERKEVPEI